VPIYSTNQTISDMTEIMDVFLKITAMPTKQESHITDKVKEYFNPILRSCSMGKWVELKTAVPTTLEYLLRIRKVTTKSMKTALHRRLTDHHGLKIEIKKCQEHHSKLLNESMDNHIVELTAVVPLSVRTQPVAAATTTLSSCPNLQVGDGGAPSTESNRSNTRTPSSGSGPQEPCIIATQAAAAAASCDSQGNSASDNAEFPALFFTAKTEKPKIAGTSSGYSSSKINFVLQSIASDTDLNSKLDFFKADLNREMQASSYEAAIDAEFNHESLLLHVRISCKWKSPRHAQTIRRMIHRAIRHRFSVIDNKIRIFNLDTALPSSCQFKSGSRWLQHSPEKGSAYTMPVENLVLELGKEVRAQEVQLLKCKTLAELRTDAKAKQVLLANLYDVLLWRYPQVPNTSGFKFQPQQPKEPALLESCHAVSTNSLHDSEAQSINSTPTVTEIPPVLVAGDSTLTPSSTDDAAPAPRRSLSFGSGCSVAQTPSGGTLSACDSGARPAGACINLFSSLRDAVVLIRQFACSCWIKPEDGA
jgi:hypothetical protein